MTGLLLLIAVVALFVSMLRWPCRFGLHRWDSPGGRCEDCGKQDNFFGDRW